MNSIDNQYQVGGSKKGRFLETMNMGIIKKLCMLMSLASTNIVLVLTVLHCIYVFCFNSFY